MIDHGIDRCAVLIAALIIEFMTVMISSSIAAFTAESITALAEELVAA